MVFSIGDFQLNWYGVLIGVGILLAMWMGFSNCKR
ncbi:MAG: prolipoprotein diacylglyceryl transferase, partial [Oscillospiraceae bacterium]|nr:prolipoprotein diacylglyceryl transferase [Oscillospiraceae bacterium]